MGSCLGTTEWDGVATDSELGAVPGDGGEDSAEVDCDLGAEPDAAVSGKDTVGSTKMEPGRIDSDEGI
jgi:hypothetical protein